MKGMKIVIYILAGIVGSCMFLFIAQGGVWLWEALEAAEARKNRRKT